jgi:hypothetical protein
LSNTNPTKNKVDGRVRSPCSTSDTHRVALVTNLMTSHEWGKYGFMITTTRTYLWTFFKARNFIDDTTDNTSLDICLDIDSQPLLNIVIISQAVLNIYTVCCMRRKNWQQHRKVLTTEMIRSIQRLYSNYGILKTNVLSDYLYNCPDKCRL